ncbi:hypothetical protein AAE02nite_47780 [Adhaeribacter aerolatus]|uniref:Phosphatidic acid phosphatase type 2/haloperoxidase domain-containing protein n=1 Tax=Adhaeribacter aerolatus TaxID=670289 RepID=A0A512B5A6_9BACT|nr:phosphatase PAP2 family protein [Adhaeribacter aerolatus]GEO07114.1 hypothetical protein AAE02nite_47780 [Adhaeribacter aerolatus]
MIKYIFLGLLLYAPGCLVPLKANSLATAINYNNLTDTLKQNPATPDSLLPQATIFLRQEPLPIPPEIKAAGSFKKNYLQPLAAPALLVGYGFLSLGNPEFLETNEGFQRVIAEQYTGFHSGLDNYTRYVPLGAVYGLNLAGVKGQHDLVNLSLIFAISSFLNNTITKNLKRISRERRPDFPSLDAFPSQHTSTAFANAEILRQEFKNQSGWYGVGGYSFAVATGALRMLNNRHWLSDVMAGAGVGILSTRLAYVIYPWLCENISLSQFKKENIQLTPMYQNGSYGLSLGLKVKQSKEKVHGKNYKAG